MLKMYAELAQWWPLLSPPEDYLEEAELYTRLFLQAGLPPDPTLIEFGSGGGSNAYHLKALFAEVTLTDISPQMLAVSRALNPGCEHIEGDMRTLRLGRQFDAVFIHDAIEYMTTLGELEQAMETAYVHCMPGGAALFVPDHVRESFRPSAEHGGTDGADRGLRYLEWSYDPDEADSQYTTHYVYLLRDGDGSVRVEHEDHICGLFARAEWLRLLGGVGFRTEIVEDPFGRDIFVGIRPSG